MLGERDDEVYPYSTQNGHAMRMPMPPAHDWEAEQRQDKDFYDDGTTTWFWLVSR